MSLTDAWQTYNHTAASQSLNALNNANLSINLSNYSSINKMTQVEDVNNATQVANSIFTPISDFWASNALWGSWFYVILIFFTIGTVYIKSQDLHRTCIAMLYMGLLAVAPASVGIIYIPSSALYALYIMTGAALAGVLYNTWVSD